RYRSQFTSHDRHLARTRADGGASRPHLPRRSRAKIIGRFHPMKKSSVPDLSRRSFIGASCCAAVGATGLLSSLASLRLMGAAASPGNGPIVPGTSAAVASDYKALVCLFLQGGN